jgi:7,8-dihydroneopterin aldolase/epimerase/oxygenase
MAIVALEGMRFFAYHGVYETERVQGNYFTVDVWMDTGKATVADSDDLVDVLNYGRIYEVAAAVMGAPKKLLESLVNAIGRKLVEEFTEVKAITVRVSKENPPVGGECRRSYVEAVFYPEDRP